MKNTSGLKKVESKFAKTDQETISRIAVKLSIDEAVVRDMMRYNVFTVNQFAQLSGMSVASVLIKTSDTVIDGVICSELNFCYPYKDLKGNGPKFIVRDDKTVKYLK